MKKSPRFVLWIIILVTVLSVLITLPAQIPINIETGKLPIINKPISIHQTFSGFNPNFVIGPFHFQRDLSFRRGLDLAGGTSITLQADMSDIPEDRRNAALESAKNVIERRVNFFGVSEPVVQTAATDKESRILVELPGVADVNEAVRLIGTTAQLSFWEEGATGSAKPEATGSALPMGIETVFQNPIKTSLTGSDLQQTSVAFDPNTSTPQVQLVFTGEGGKKFGDITKRNTGKIVAIALDKEIIQAPRVDEPILNGNAVISGSFTSEQAKALSIQLNAGALPVPLSVLQQESIGATLGNESLAKSLVAGVIGFIVIVVFMIVLYGKPGVLASIALCLYVVFTLALFKFIPITLTLAGIAGFILSIGMAVDANILIFERMKEEIRSGKSLPVASELGFSRAWTSIRDSNVSSLITSAILFYFGTGGVKGFALTLALGVLVSMFSAIIVTRTFLRMVYRK